MLDCILVGYNDIDFGDFVQMVRGMGTEAGAFKDLRLAYVDHEGQPYRSMDMLNHFYLPGKPESTRPFSNTDFLWPVITYLGSYLHQRGFAYDYINLFHRDKERLRELLTTQEVLTVAITTTLYVTPQPIMEVVNFVRQYNPDVKIIVGGPYVSSQTEVLDEEGLQRIFTTLDGDYYIVSHEGEHTLTELLHALKAGERPELVPNLIHRRNGRFQSTHTVRESNPLEENRVDYTLFPRHQFGEFVTLRTAKSCPFSCAFCRFPIRAGKYVYLSVEDIENELDQIAALGTVTTLTFIDDTFNIPPKRFKAMLRMMIRKQYHFKWNCFYRADHGDAETIALMQEAGCEGVFLGIESGTDPMLKRMNKSARQRHYREAIPQFRAAGILTFASLIIGFPGETRESVQGTIDFLEELRPDYYRAQLWFCDPTTPIWDQREEYGLKGTGFNWKHDTMRVSEAAAAIDHMFLTVENSIWLPQHGFEMWSIYYLQRHGISLEQIDTFLSNFNAAVAEQLLNPGKSEIDLALLQTMKAAVSPNGQKEVSSADSASYTPVKYNESVRYWRKLFDGYSNGEALFSGLDVPTIDASISEEVDDQLLTEAAVACAITKETLLVAAYLLLLARLGEGADVTALLATERDGEAILVPLRILAQQDIPFSNFAGHVARQIDESIAHQHAALFLLSQPLQATLSELDSPDFSAVIALGDRSPEQAESLFWEMSKFFPGTAVNVRLLLCGATQDAGQLTLKHPPQLNAAIAREMLEFVKMLLGAIAQNPHTPIGQLAFIEPTEPLVKTPASDSEALFNF